MKKTVLASVAAAATLASLPFTAFASTRTTSTTASPTVQYVETTHGWVDYHHSPLLSSPVEGRLLLGDEALLVKKANTWWYEIEVQGKTEYITTDSKYTKIVAATTSTTSTTTPATAPTATSSTPGTSTSSTAAPSWQTQANTLIAKAETQLGVPYLWGKQEPGIGFDCSNFVAWSYRTALGISFSGSSVYQRYHVGTPVPLTDIRPGDLLFFATGNNSTGSGHVGIYMGNGKLIQEGGGFAKVTIEPLSGTWFGRNLVFARRVIQ